MNDPNLKVEVIFKNKGQLDSPTTSMAFLGPNDILVLEKNKGTVQRIIKQRMLLQQVLETLAKSGIPTRAEITDAAMGYRAECVMLNKGKHILEATKTLSFLLHGEEKHHIKKRQIFRDFTKQQGVFDYEEESLS